MIDTRWLSVLDLIFQSEEHTLQVDGDDLVEFLDGHVRQIFGGRQHTGIVEDAGRATKMIDGGLDKRLHRCRVADVSVHEQGFTAELVQLGNGFGGTLAGRRR
ncbi:MAG: hypothetical protein Q8R81_02460 [Novosphingobium sp.]|nr:hypothetical protein [Novosphingobium sp.]MDP3549237.1 hypothetical protein [Novosphingobium sp.]